MNTRACTAEKFTDENGEKMNRKNAKYLIILFILAMCLSFCACGESESETSPEAVSEPEVAETPAPTPTPVPICTILGQKVRADAETLDLSAITEEEISDVAQELTQLTGLKTIVLGSESEERPLSWEGIRELHDAAPQAAIDYSFTIFKKQFNLSDEEMDLKHIKMDDEGELVKAVTACMTNLTYLDMDSCQVSNEKMAEIRDSLPNANVVWRIKFGRFYSVRTDVEKILASMPGKAGELVHNNVEALKYCTKVKYIDLGHNNYLNTIEFCRYMPDLEVAVLALNAVEDFSPLAECPKLEYLEAFTSRLHDLTPLAECKNLRHLNICYNFAINDITPLYDLPNLERVWIGKYDPVPPEQIAKLRELHPNCVVNDTTEDPTAEEWRFSNVGDAMGNPRYAERYALLKEQFGYTEDDYAYYWLDPLYDYSWIPPEVEPDAVEDFPYVP